MFTVAIFQNIYSEHLTYFFEMYITVDKGGTKITTIRVNMWNTECENTDNCSYH